jgi:hypothetical protein
MMSYDRQRYLYVENGTLTVPQLTGSNYHVYAGPQAHIHSDGGFLFRSASGQLASGLQSVNLRQESTLVLRGSMDLDVTGVDVNTPFQSQLRGTFREMGVDGKPLSWSAAPRSSVSLPWRGGLGIFFGIVFLAGLAVVARYAVREFGLRRLKPGPGSTEKAWALHERALELHAGRRNREAVSLLDKAIRLDPDSPEHYALRATCWTSLKRPRIRRALRDHLEAHYLRQDHRDGAGNAYEASRLFALLGRGRESAHWLCIALRLDPSYRRKAVLEADFAKVVTYPTVSDILQSGQAAKALR